MRNRRGLRIATFVCGALLAACQTVPSPPWVPVHGEDVRIRAWIQDSQSRGARHERVRIVGSLKLDTPDGSGRLKQVIVAERPDRLRLESLNLLGQTQSLLVTDGERFSFYDGQQLLHGAATREVLLQHLGLDFTPEEAVRLVLGAPLDGVATPDRLAVLGAGDDRLVAMPFGRVRFDPTGEVRRVDRFDAEGRSRWSASFERWREVPGGRYPEEMSLNFPRTNLRAELELKDVEINPPIQASLFRVPSREKE